MTNTWKLISLGRGYYSVILKFSSEKTSVWSRGSIALKPGILRLQPWQPDFDPMAQKSSNSHIWVRFYKLPWELWDGQILADIAKNISVPLRIDRATLDGDFGHVA